MTPTHAINWNQNRGISLLSHLTLCAGDSRGSRDKRRSERHVCTGRKRESQRPRSPVELRSNSDSDRAPTNLVYGTDNRPGQATLLENYGCVICSMFPTKNSRSVPVGPQNVFYYCVLEMLSRFRGAFVTVALCWGKCIANHYKTLYRKYIICFTMHFKRHKWALVLNQTLSVLFSTTDPSSGLSVSAAILPNVCGPAGIPCFHSEFPVVRGAESSKERSHPGNSWNPRVEWAQNTTYINALTHSAARRLDSRGRGGVCVCVRGRGDSVSILGGR